MIPAPTSIEELSNRYVRLVRLEDDTWCIDMVKASNREDIEAAGSLTVGEVLTYGVDPGEMKAKSVHPLWFLGSLN